MRPQNAQGAFTRDWKTKGRPLSRPALLYLERRKNYLAPSCISGMPATWVFGFSG